MRYKIAVLIISLLSSPLAWSDTKSLSDIKFNSLLKDYCAEWNTLLKFMGESRSADCMAEKQVDIRIGAIDWNSVKSLRLKNFELKAKEQHAKLQGWDNPPKQAQQNVPEKLKEPQMLAIEHIAHKETVKESGSNLPLALLFLTIMAGVVSARRYFN